MVDSASDADRRAAVQEGFRTLPERYLGADAGFDATYELRFTDLGLTWEVRATEAAIRVHTGVTRSEPDVTITTDAATWLALREGRLSGLDAFAQRRLAARGNLTWRSPSRGSSDWPTGARRCCASTTSRSAASGSRP